MTASPDPPLQLPAHAVRALLEGTRAIEYLRISSDGTIAEVNPTLARSFRSSPEDLSGKPFVECLTADDADRARAWLEDSDPLPDRTTLLNFVTPGHEVRTLSCLVLRDRDGLIVLGEPDVAENRHVAEELLRLNNELSVLARENARKTREVEAARAKLAATLAELEHSHWHLRKIQEHLPICMECGKIRSGEAEWASLVDYLRSNEIFVTHGYCPTCADILLAEEGL